MPIVQFITNVDRKNFPSDFNMKFLEALSKTLRYEVWRFFLHISDGQNCTSGGTDQPSALIKIESLGHLSEEENAAHTKCIAEFLENTLGLDNDHVYVIFRTIDAGNVGRRGTTVKQTFRQFPEFSVE